MKKLDIFIKIAIFSIMNEHQTDSATSGRLTGNSLVEQAGDALCRLLVSVPSITPGRVEREKQIGARGFRADGCVSFRHGDTSYTVVIEAKVKGAPRFIRAATYDLLGCIMQARGLSKAAEASRLGRIIPMVVSPYLSPEARALCVEHDVAYLDLVGNARLFFGDVYIEREVADKPKAEARALRSVFKPKASAILRVMLRDHRHSWRVAELAKKAQASLGHVSNVRKALLEREWVDTTKDGIVLSKPDALLKAWRKNYHKPSGSHTIAYTHLHGKSLDDKLPEVLNSSADGPRAIYSLHSAANWYAPYGRNNMHTFYADEAGADALKGVLKLTSAPKGANVDILTVGDENIFIDAEKPAPGFFCAAPVITYLDLWNGNERDREAAEHLGRKMFSWLN